MWLGGTGHSCSSRLHPGHLVCHVGFCTVPASPRLSTLQCGWWINQAQEMHKPCHKEQQQESHRTFSGRYFKALVKWRRWQLRTPPRAASSGEPEQPVRGISWQTELDPAQLPQGQTCCPLLPPAHRGTLVPPSTPAPLVISAPSPPACSCCTHRKATQAHRQETCFPIC